jgi:hypothetical protein
MIPRTAEDGMEGGESQRCRFVQDPFLHEAPQEAPEVAGHRGGQ